MAKSKELRNREGYTWVEWLAAVGLSVGSVVPQRTLAKLSVAWEVSEDPADHRKLFLAIHHAEEQRKQGPHETHDHIGKLVCMKCGSSEPELFRYVETIESYRPVQAVAGGKILVEGSYRTGEGYDEDGKNPYFECHAQVRAKDGISTDLCLHRMPIPDWVYKRIEWT